MAQTRPSPTLSRGFTRLGRFLAPHHTGSASAQVGSSSDAASTIIYRVGRGDRGLIP